jgi:hypothetical protein
MGGLGCGIYSKGASTVGNSHGCHADVSIRYVRQKGRVASCQESHEQIHDLLGFVV